MLQRVHGAELVEEARLFPANPATGWHGDEVQRLDLGPYQLFLSYEHQVRVKPYEVGSMSARGLIAGLASPHPIGSLLPAVYRQEEEGFGQQLVGGFDIALAPRVLHPRQPRRLPGPGPGADRLPRLARGLARPGPRRHLDTGAATPAPGAGG